MENKMTCGLYPGSFNRFHVGHADILRQANLIFAHRVVVAVGINPAKGKIQELIAQRQSQIPVLQTLLRHNPVRFMPGLLADFIIQLEQELQIGVTLVRGLRSDTDFKKEMIDLQYLRDWLPDLKVIFLSCNKQYEHISSSALRTLENELTVDISQYLPCYEDIYNQNYNDSFTANWKDFVLKFEQDSK